MKVKIMDYETAKAEVLAREQNPCIANERHVYGVDKTWAGWGQVRDVYKHIDYFLDVEDGYEFPLYLIFIGIFFIPPFGLNVKFACFNVFTNCLQFNNLGFLARIFLWLIPKYRLH